MKKLGASIVICFCLVMAILPYILDRHFYPFLNPVMFEDVYFEPVIYREEYKAVFKGDVQETDISYWHPFFRPKTGFTFAVTLLYLTGHLEGEERVEKVKTAIAKKMETSNFLIRSGRYPEEREISVLRVFEKKIVLTDTGRVNESQSYENLLFEVRADEESLE